MTNHWVDLRNADVVLAMGANPASNHPISFKWVTKAMEKGGKLVSVDPRFTPTSAKADVYAPLRSGTDIAFLGGMINYILTNKLYNEAYMKLYTNASFLIDPGFKGPGANGGVFSGLTGGAKNPALGMVGAKYDKATWAFMKNADGTVKKDLTFSDPNCVFQLLKKHYARYTPQVVSEVCGTPQDKLAEVWATYASTGKPDRVGTIMYAMGWTQHTVGVQNIRAMSMIQLLLGNIGLAGGGVNAMRGESNVQGSTDFGLLFHILPGYLAQPRANTQQTLEEYGKQWPESKDPRSLNWWLNGPKYMASYLRAFYGMNPDAKGLKDFGYTWLPKLDATQNASWLQLFDRMAKGGFEGFFAWGQNPACSSANAGKVRRAMAKLKWMVTVNIFDTETAEFWRGPEFRGQESSVQTEVFFLPCAASYEKEGSLANSGRLTQWRYKAVNPPGQAMPDAEIISELFFKVKDLYKNEGGAFPDPILGTTWDYGPKKPNGHLWYLDIHAVAKEINGSWMKEVWLDATNKQVEPNTPGATKYAAGSQVPSFAFLQADGSSSCGCWVYSQQYNAAGNNLARRGRKDPTGIGTYPEWAWCWPVNRHIIYNRASVDELGRPWDPKRPVIYWKGVAADGKWTGGAWIGDVPDGAQPPLKNPDGTDNAASKYAFIMKTEGYAHIFGPGLADGPFPEHYEPLECPIEKNPMVLDDGKTGNPQKINPTVKVFGQEGEEAGGDVYYACNPKFPFVGSTYRVTEHWQTGVMTRHTPWLVEMQPANFCEMSEELAELRSVKNGDIVIVESARGQVEAVAMVTKRYKPFPLGNGVVIHQVGLPWHFGWITTKEGVYQRNPYPTFGDTVNLLTPTVGDPNTMIPESKAFMVNVRKKEG